jgi:hypothetical protein
MAFNASAYFWNCCEKAWNSAEFTSTWISVLAVTRHPSVSHHRWKTTTYWWQVIIFRWPRWRNLLRVGRRMRAAAFQPQGKLFQARRRNPELFSRHADGQQLALV